MANGQNLPVCLNLIFGMSIFWPVSPIETFCFVWFFFFTCLFSFYLLDSLFFGFQPENLLYADESDKAALKISDFGLSKMLYGEQGNTSTVCGTPGYCGKVRTACCYYYYYFYFLNRIKDGAY